MPLWVVWPSLLWPVTVTVWLPVVGTPAKVPLATPSFTVRVTVCSPSWAVRADVSGSTGLAVTVTSAFTRSKVRGAVTLPLDRLMLVWAAYSTTPPGTSYARTVTVYLGSPFGRPLRSALACPSWMTPGNTLPPGSLLPCRVKVTALAPSGTVTVRASGLTDRLCRLFCAPGTEAGAAWAGAVAASVTGAGD